MLALIFMIAFATIFYKVADIENLNMPGVWAGASVLLFFFGGGGWLGLFAWQFLLFIWLGGWLYYQNQRVANAEINRQ